MPDDDTAELDGALGDGSGDPSVRDPLAPRIVYPFDGARFVIDPERPAELQLLEIRVEPEGTTVEVRVDDTIVSKTRTWPLAPGTHTITARNGSHASSPIRITVR